jgi:hypothetical protein
MDEVRRQSTHASKAIAEQARAAKEVEASAAEVAQLAVQVARAVSEQTEATTGLAKESEEVRRIAKQGARAVSEQSQMLATLNASTQRYIGAVDRIVSSVAEQASGSQQVSHAVVDVRTRARELSSSIAAQARSAKGTDLAELAAGIQACEPRTWLKRTLWLRWARSCCPPRRRRPCPRARRRPTLQPQRKSSRSECERLAPSAGRGPASEAERSAELRRLVARGHGGVDGLLAMRTDPSWSVRREVIAALAEIGEAALAALSSSLLRERDDETRVAATVDALVASAGDTEAALIAMSAGAEPAVLADVAQILGRRRQVASIPTLAELAQHPDDNVAVGAIEALGRVAAARWWTCWWRPSRAAGSSAPLPPSTCSARAATRAPSFRLPRCSTTSTTRWRRPGRWGAAAIAPRSRRSPGC